MCTYLDIVDIAVSWRDSWFVALSFSHRSCGSRRPRRDISRPKKLHKTKNGKTNIAQAHCIFCHEFRSYRPTLTMYNGLSMEPFFKFYRLPNLFALFCIVLHCLSQNMSTLSALQGSGLAKWSERIFAAGLLGGGRARHNFVRFGLPTSQNAFGARDT